MSRHCSARSSPARRPVRRAHSTQGCQRGYCAAAVLTRCAASSRVRGCTIAFGSVQLHTYYSPLQYLATVYAVPAAGAPYVFYPEDVVQFEAKLINRGSVPVSIRMRADPSTQISLSTRTPLRESAQLPRDTWTVASDEFRIQPRDAPEVLVAADSSVVLHPDAALIFQSRSLVRPSGRVEQSPWLSTFRSSVSRRAPSCRFRICFDSRCERPST